MKILVMGLPGAGKTYLAQYILEQLQNNIKSVTWLNADIIRKKYNDWDFSYEGRIRQAERMKVFASDAHTDYVICDFVCPLPEMREIFDADWTIWVDTIKESRYENTNKAFIPPEKYDFRITEQDSVKWSEYIAVNILNNTRPQET